MRRFRNIPPLQYLLGFEAAARLESFSKAAEELGLSASAISHEMRLLEERLGQPLFIRKGRAIWLTDARSRLSTHGHAVFGAVGRWFPAFGALPQTWQRCDLL